MSVAVEQDKGPAGRAVETARGERPEGREDSGWAGTSGGAGGTSGDTEELARRSFRHAYALLSSAVLGVCTVGALSSVDEHARIGHEIAAWKPFVFEGTSAAVIIALAPFVHAVLRRCPASGGRAVRFVATHALAAILFSMLHVGGMVGLRKLIFALGGQSYSFGFTASELIYELRKDLFVYAAIAGTFWMIRRLAELELAARDRAAPSPLASGSGLLALRDGARTLQVRVADLRWAASAGNYVEIALADGRKPLIRGTLKSFETMLAPHGFVRVHRTRVINPGRIVAVEATESGDLALTLDDGSRLAGSRRYRAGIDRAILAAPK